MSLADFHFLRPLWLLALLPLAFLAWRLRPGAEQTRDWERVCDPALLPHVLESREGRPRTTLRRALVAAAALAVLAQAGPAWERLPVPVVRDDASLVVVLDLSRSMDASDLEPSRLARARFEVADLLARRPTVQVGLVVYARDAFVVTPLTTDAQTLLSQLPVLATDLMPVQGSRAERGVEKAAELLVQAGVRGGEVLLVTDGVDERAAQAIETLAGEARLRVSVLALGTPEGAPIPLRQGGFQNDREGNPVMAGLETATLQRLAAATGGLLVQAVPEDSDSTRLAAHLGRAGKALDPEDPELATEAEGATLWRDQGPWLLLLALPLAALVFRRGVWLASLLVFGLALPWARPAEALEWRALQWRDLWQRADQQGAAALEAGDPAAAAERFQDPAWKAAAHHRAQHYEQALAALDGRVGADDLYNRGNALARLGRYQEAIAFYNSALAADPGHEDARYNREVLERALAEQNPPQSGSGGPPEDGETQGEPPEGGEEGESGGADPSQREGSPGGEGGSPPDGAQSPAQPDSAGEGEATDADAETEPEPEPDTGNEPEPGTNPPQENQGQPSELTEGTPEASDEETRQAMEQWLRRVPDDPGGLLRRKFQLQARRQYTDTPEEEQPW